MYSYQHKYHAGNFADLHKHITLIAILKHLHKKPAPFCALDLFAGDGVYDLSTLEAQKNQEYDSGFGLLENLSVLPKMATQEINLFQELLDSTAAKIYPGSPEIIKTFLRDQDKAIFIENHPQSFAALERNFKYLRNIKTYKSNAYEVVNSFIPYKETRGVILIDPSYEVKTEYQDIVDLVYEAYQRKATGIFILWYPILVHNNYYKKLDALLDKVSQKHSCNTWKHELMLSPQDNSKSFGMIGSGIIVLNMPWMIDTLLEQHFNQVKDLI